MQRIGIRRYVGASGETVTAVATPPGSAAAKFVLDGKDRGTSSPFQFNLAGGPGDTHDLSIALIGEVGSMCNVAIGPINGGSDPDVLVSTQHDPFPVHHYEFVIVAE